MTSVYNYYCSTHLVPRAKVTDLAQYDVDEYHEVSGVEHSGRLFGGKHVKSKLGQCVWTQWLLQRHWVLWREGGREGGREEGRGW